MMEQIIEVETIKAAIFFIKVLVSVGVGFLGIISALIVYIHQDGKKIAKERDEAMDKRVDTLIEVQSQFIEEMAEFKADIAKIFVWLKTHEKRLDKIDKR